MRFAEGLYDSLYNEPGVYQALGDDGVEAFDNLCRTLWFARKSELIEWDTIWKVMGRFGIERERLVEELIFT